MANLDAIVEAQSSLEATVSRQFAEFEKTLRSTSPKNYTVDSLSAELQKFKETTFATMSAITKQIASLVSSVDILEMRHRRKFLIFAGIAESTDEDVAAVVASICQNKMQIAEASPSSFAACHRVGAPSAGRTRLVLVKCADILLKNLIWRKKTSLKGTSIVVSEFLTRQRRAIFLQARKHFGIRRVWSHDGNVFIKLASGNAERVATSDQLQILMDKHPMETSNVPGGDLASTNSELAEAQEGADVSSEPAVAAVTTPAAVTSLKSQSTAPVNPAAPAVKASSTPKVEESEAKKAAGSSARPARKARKDLYVPPAPKTC